MTSDPPADYDKFDHYDPSIAEDPFPFFADARAHCPVLKGTEYGGFWALTGYEDIVMALHDPATFSSAQGVSVPHLGNIAPAIPIELDPPDHQEFRRLLLPNLSPQVVANLEPDIRHIARGLIDEFLPRGQCDLVGDFAVPLPSFVLAHVVGIPEAQWPRFATLTGRLIETSRSDDWEENLEVVAEIYAMLEELIESRRRAIEGNDELPDDIATTLVTGEVFGRPLDDEEILGYLLLLFLAGHETTTNATAMSLRYLEQHPDRRAEFTRDPRLIASAIEELLRLHSPVQCLARTVVKDVELHGREMHQGDKVLILYNSANRDEQEFPDPDEMVIHRHPNRHVAFGLGIHRCLGAHLARIELRVALEEILDRLPDYRLEPDREVTWHTGLVRGLRAYPAVFSPPPAS